MGVERVPAPPTSRGRRGAHHEGDEDPAAAGRGSGGGVAADALRRRARGCRSQPGGASAGTLHTSGTDTRIYSAGGQPVRLLGFNWPGTPTGGRTDALKAKDDCGNVWRTPADKLSGLTFSYDNMYQVVHDWGYNTIRIPVSWNNLEPVAPVWNATTGQYMHTWSAAYLNDLRSMVTKAQAAGLWVVLDLHQDFWSPALHHIVKWNGQQGLCEGVGMPAGWTPASTRSPARPSRSTSTNAMNWFYRNVPDPASTLTHATPVAAVPGRRGRSCPTSSRPARASRRYRAVVGADLLNEPYAKYVGGEPARGPDRVPGSGLPAQRLLHGGGAGGHRRQPGLAARSSRTRPAATTPPCPAGRETPVLTGRPGGDVNWVYSMHDYDFGYGTFSDGVARHDDFGITLMNVDLANAAGVARASLRR